MRRFAVKTVTIAAVALVEAPPPHLRAMGGRIASRWLADRSDGANKPFLTRRWCSTSGRAVRGSDDGVEELVVELLDPVEEVLNTDSRRGIAPDDLISDEPYRDVTRIDQFSKAKVLNFIKRSAVDAGGAPGGHPVAHTTASAFQVKRIISFDDATHHMAQLQIPLPAEFGTRVAEGVAMTAKDAEALAAMHAEEIIDALGLQMCALSGAQRRHAEAAKAAGRWAPMPGDAPRDPSTPSPPPLRMVAPPQSSECSNYTTVARGSFSPLLCTLASPTLLDNGSRARMKQFFDACGVRINKMTRVLTLEPLRPGDRMEYVAQLKLCLPDKFGPRIATGRAFDKATALTLACMHGELVIDALGVPLYPGNVARQTQHAEECRRLGRWAALPHEAPVNFEQASPPALKIASDAEAAKEARDATPSCKRGSDSEAAMVAHARAVAAMRTFILITEKDPEAKRRLAAFSASTEGADRGANRHFSASESYVTEQLGPRSSATFRSTVLISVPEELGSQCVAIGIADTESDAELVAAMNALSIIEQLTLKHNSCGREEQNCFEKVGIAEESISTTAFPAFKLRSHCRKRGRMQLGISKEERIEDENQQGHTPEWHVDSSVSSPAHEEQAALDAIRQSAPREQWCLEADAADGFIIISPSASAKDAQTFVHTLASPRVLDIRAPERLADYLERHGIPSKGAVNIERVDAGDASRPLFRASVRLPVPHAVGPRIARAEAYSAADAEVLVAMHAELVLDSLGVPLFDHTVLQRRHAETARSTGRHAPLPGGPLASADTPSPPPLRKENAQSVSWMRYVQRVHGPNANVNTAVPPPAATDPDAALLVTLTPFNPRDVVPSVRNRVENYFHRHGAQISSMQRYTVGKAGVNAEHRARLNVPVPPQFGTRVAFAVAATRRDAFFLCLTHAERIIDALGLQMETNPLKQARHVQFAKAAGRLAPMPGDLPSPPETPTPPGLRGTALATSEELCAGAPQPPTGPSASLEPVTWTAYVRACAAHIRKVEENWLHSAMLVDKSPRRGCAVEDALLDVVEAVPSPDPHAKSVLRSCCERHGFESPPNWDLITLGRGAEKRFAVDAVVLGTPYRARGVGRDSRDAVARAAMHYKLIIERIATSFRESSLSVKQFHSHALPQGSSSTRTAAPSAAPAQAEESAVVVDAVTNALTPRAKLLLAKSFIRMQPMARLTVSAKERHLAPTGRGDGDTMYVTLVDASFGDGSRVVGKGALTNVQGSRMKAWDDFHTQLTAAKHAYVSLQHFVKEHHGTIRLDLHLETHVKEGTELHSLLHTRHGVEQQERMGSRGAGGGRRGCSWELCPLPVLPSCFSSSNLEGAAGQWLQRVRGHLRGKAVLGDPRNVYVIAGPPASGRSTVLPIALACYEGSAGRVKRVLLVTRGAAPSKLALEQLGVHAIDGDDADGVGNPSAPVVVTRSLECALRGFATASREQWFDFVIFDDFHAYALLQQRAIAEVVAFVAFGNRENRKSTCACFVTVPEHVEEVGSFLESYRLIVAHSVAAHDGPAGLRPPEKGDELRVLPVAHSSDGRSPLFMPLQDWLIGRIGRNWHDHPIAIIRVDSRQQATILSKEISATLSVRLASTTEELSAILSHVSSEGIKSLLGPIVVMTKEPAALPIPPESVGLVLLPATCVPGGMECEETSFSGPHCYFVTAAAASKRSMHRGRHNAGSSCGVAADLLFAYLAGSCSIPKAESLSAIAALTSAQQSASARLLTEHDERAAVSMTSWGAALWSLCIRGVDADVAQALMAGILCHCHDATLTAVAAVMVARQADRTGALGPRAAAMPHRLADVIQQYLRHGIDAKEGDEACEWVNSVTQWKQLFASTLDHVGFLGRASWTSSLVMRSTTVADATPFSLHAGNAAIVQFALSCGFADSLQFGSVADLRTTGDFCTLQLLGSKMAVLELPVDPWIAWLGARPLSQRVPAGSGDAAPEIDGDRPILLHQTLLLHCHADAGNCAGRLEHFKHHVRRTLSRMQPLPMPQLKTLSLLVSQSSSTWVTHEVDRDESTVMQFTSSARRMELTV